MATRRSSQLTVAFSPKWLKQPAWDTPIGADELTAAFPATSKNYLDIDETNEEVFDCTGEDFLFELLTRRVARLNLEFDVDPDILAGMVAFAYGVAASPSGGTNEVQTMTINATGGTYSLVVTKGANSQITAPIAYNANAAAIQAALEALSNVDAADIVVTGTGPFVFTFSGTNYTKQEVSMITVNTFLLTGGTATIVETTPGVGQTHAISRISAYTLPLMTFYIGFRGSDKQPLIFKNVVVNLVRVRATSAIPNKVTATVELIGSADLQTAVGFTMPACMDIIPVRFGDCQMSLGGIDYIAQNLGREFEVFVQNDVVPQYDGAGVDMTRAERADRRPSGMNLFILGEIGDAVEIQARNKTTLPVFVRVGPSTKNVKFTAPQGLVKRQPTPIRFGGDPAESELAILVRPRKISGDSTTPTTVTAVTSQATAYLTADS